MSTTEQKALAIQMAEQFEYDWPSSGWAIEIANELRRLSAENEALRLQIFDHQLVLRGWEVRTEWLRTSLEPWECGDHLADVLRARIEALRAQVEALTVENQALWTDRSTLQSQRDAFLEAGLRARHLLVRDRDAADEAHTGTDGEIDADGARAVAEFNAVIAYIDSAVEGAKKVHPTPSPLTRPASAVAQEARGYVREITTAWDRDNLHDCIDRLEEMASRQAQTTALTRLAVPEEFLESPDIPDEDSGLNTYYSRELVLECIAAALAAATQPPYKDSTPHLSVGESSFESWYSTYDAARKGDKQRARDAYAAGMGDPLVQAAPQPEATGPSGDKLSDFNEGQWWLAELDAAVANGTPDQKRAVAVVRNLLKTAHAALAAPQPEAQPTEAAHPALSDAVIREKARLYVQAGRSWRGCWSQETEWFAQVLEMGYIKGMTAAQTGGA